jgi:CheY-like chemotaxis protein
MARILLIEDNDGLRPLLRITLEVAGHEVAEACNGDEGLRLYRECPPDVVVCDLFMPEKDGLETIRELRASGDVKIIAISGDGMMASGGMLDIARALGAAKTLSKPVYAETLLEALEEVLCGSI